jgi:two-component system chemotaxis response regulator CheY
MAKLTRILVVDDNDVMRTLLRGILRGETFEVVGEARNGHAAVELTERLKPDIVCMDVMMPEMDGLEALQAIKAGEVDCAVVMITASATADTVRLAIESGAAGYIVKPFNSAKVLDTLGRIVAQRSKA